MDWHSRRITGILENALREDSVTRDATTYACVDPHQVAAATILAKQDCVLAGLGLVARIFDVFAALDGTVLEYPEVTSHPEVFDGVRLHRGQSVAVIRHNARVILSCERVILNFMQRLSGIATLTRRFVDAVVGTRARILDTRKTVPGLRDAGQVRGRLRRRIQPPARSFRRRAHQEQPHRGGRRDRAGAGARAAQPPRRAGDRDRGALARRNSKRRSPTAPKPSCSTTCRWMT